MRTGLSATLFYQTHYQSGFLIGWVDLCIKIVFDGVGLSLFWAILECFFYHGM